MMKYSRIVAIPTNKIIFYREIPRLDLCHVAILFTPVLLRQSWRQLVTNYCLNIDSLVG